VVVKPTVLPVWRKRCAMRRVVVVLPLVPVTGEHRDLVSVPGA
jgi:hypothetical protein